MKKYSILVLVPLLVTVIFGMIYVAGQQILRQDANDPQIQLAEDATTALNQGKLPGEVIGSKVDMQTSLSPFTIIYTTAGHEVASSGYLGNTVPTVPTGVLPASVGQTYNVVTWQPLATVRIAAVVVKAHNYYVLSGRSLVEVEKREDHLMKLAAGGWIVAMICFIFSCSLAYSKSKPATRHA